VNYLVTFALLRH